LRLPEADKVTAPVRTWYRLPAAAEYALAVEKEHLWLPRLAAQLPLPISAPLGAGAPSATTPTGRQLP
jgi:hypothetical protein